MYGLSPFRSHNDPRRHAVAYGDCLHRTRPLSYSRAENMPPLPPSTEMHPAAVSPAVAQAVALRSGAGSSLPTGFLLSMKIVPCVGCSPLSLRLDSTALPGHTWHVSL